MGSAGALVSQLTVMCVLAAAFAADVCARGADCVVPAWAGKLRLRARPAAAASTARIRGILGEPCFVLALRAISVHLLSAGIGTDGEVAGGVRSSARHNLDPTARRWLGRSQRVHEKCAAIGSNCQGLWISLVLMVLLLWPGRTVW